MNLTCRGTQ